jgi:DNA-binding MltR family transcriptional regulator
VLQVFRKDDYAVKYAVEPLLDGSGPLAIFRSGSSLSMGWA